MSRVGILSHEDYLASVTIHWYELGLRVTYVDRTRDLSDYILLEKYQTEIYDWLETTCQGNFVVHENGIWFVKGSDAMMFKLAWAGRIK